MSKPPDSALVHLYRGELGRVAIYRVRLDTTTNWAIGVSVAVITFALGQGDAPHVILVLPYVLTTVFLFIESRRFQELEMFRKRVRTMETAYFVKALRGEHLEDGWGAKLADELEQPTPQISLMAAISHRVNRNYLWLFAFIEAAWLMKLWLIDEDLLQAAAIGTLPGGLVILISFILMIPWPYLALEASRSLRG